MNDPLHQINTLPLAEAQTLLDGVYEHSPWIVAEALAARPFATLAAFKRAAVEVVRKAGRERQIALVRAHPELAGRAMVARTMTAESTAEQGRAGLSACTPEEFARLQQLNAAYNARFGWPFILAVRGPRGTGLTPAQVIAAFERRLAAPPDMELAECLRNIHRVAELRIDDKFGVVPALGNQVWDWAEALARHSDPGYAEAGQLTVTYLTDAHRACARELQQWMRECGFDEVSEDALGNVVGVYHGSEPTSDGAMPLHDSFGPASTPPPSPSPAGGGGENSLPCEAGEGWGGGVSATSRHRRSPARLLTGSHYDTVRNAGKYDGRLGILVPMVCVRELHRQGRRLPFGIEVVGFAEEEGQRYKAAFLGSSALTGEFDPAWLEQRDTDGISMRAAMQAAGLPATMEAIATLRRDPAQYLAFVEVHIEQGPVLAELDLPLGVVTSINGSLRYLGEVLGTASHAGTTPMDRRRDAACAVAELALYVERRAAATPNVVATMGQLAVPNGSINVVPGRCSFSLDIRAPDDATRDACAADVRAELTAICARRGLDYRLEEALRVAAAASAPDVQARWERAVARLGLPVYRMPSGAGHDAMMLARTMPQAMLFLRGGNLGISHNPLETIGNDDAQLCVEAFAALLDDLAVREVVDDPSPPAPRPLMRARGANNPSPASAGEGGAEGAG
ncbi:MAG: 2-oxo-4-hydroxy-4-carboxy-5-ureidoimidazoline decarboxylase [Betaproteobacteria bacterium]